VQFNLFAGSILGLGGPEQVARLEQLQDDATLGCFALTERAAGVSSGLVVNTTATWDPTSQTFVLHTPDEVQPAPLNSYTHCSPSQPAHSCGSNPS
jgi:acyl-CoA oxidase